MIKQTIVNRRNRRALQQSQGSLAAPVIAVITLGSQTPKQINAAFNEPVVVKGVPALFKLAGVSPTAVTVTDSTHITLAYATPPAVGQSYAFAALEPNIRSYSGGSVAAAAGTF